MTTSETVNKIRDSSDIGYWRILIRPTEFNKHSIESLPKCWDIIEKSIVHLRGWPYPHIDINHKNNGQDYIESVSENKQTTEWFRFYQSSQFINYKTLREDCDELLPQVKNTLNNNGFVATKGLEYVNTIWTITEIYEFCNRLIKHGNYSGNIELLITLNGTNNRSLFFFTPERSFHEEYTCKIPNILINNTYAISDFIAKYLDYIVDSSEQIFHRFNMNDVSHELIRLDRDRLLNRLF